MRENADKNNSEKDTLYALLQGRFPDAPYMIDVFDWKDDFMFIFSPHYHVLEIFAWNLIISEVITFI